MTDALVIMLCAAGGVLFVHGGARNCANADVYTRIQCSSKTITAGALPLLAALAIAKGPLTAYGARALIVAALLLLVNPIASHALVRAAYKTGVPTWPGAVIDEPAQSRRKAGDTR